MRKNKTECKSVKTGGDAGLHWRLVNVSLAEGTRFVLRQPDVNTLAVEVVFAE